MPAAHDAARDDSVPARIDPFAFAALPAAWADWMRRLMVENRLPLSGNVDQLIDTWGQVASQVGLVNFNLAGAKDPALERRIGAEYSYGRQLGRILDVLAPLVEANPQLFDTDERKRLRGDFERMLADIRRMKAKARGGVEGVLDEVRSWRDEEDFPARLARLRQALASLDPAG